MRRRAGGLMNFWNWSDVLNSPSLFLTVFAFLLLLGPLVVLHELGHYLAGRLLGVRAEVFSVGMGKELWHRIDRRGTRWRIAALPVGGFVMFAGDADPSGRPANFSGNRPGEPPGMASSQAAKGTLSGARLWQRALIVAAGPFTNWLVAVLIFAGFAFVGGIANISPTVGRFTPRSVAQAAGVQVGDRILAIDGAPINAFGEIVDKVMLYPGHQVVVRIDRAGRSLELPVRLGELAEKDEFGNETRRGMLGIRPGGKVEVVYPGPIGALGEGVKMSGRMLRMITISLGQIITGERSVRDLGGPARTAKASGEALTLGGPSFLWFAGFVSINLAFINLLPIPTLDGGHLAFYAAEALRRKPLGIRGQQWAFRTGLAIVLGFAMFVTWNDIVMLMFK